MNDILQWAMLGEPGTMFILFGTNTGRIHNVKLGEVVRVSDGFYVARVIHSPKSQTLRDVNGVFRTIVEAQEAVVAALVSQRLEQ